MSNEERIELLKEVARVAPKEMNATYKDCMEGTPATNNPYVLFVHPVACLLSIDGYPGDGNAIIAMLDAMEKAGVCPGLTPIYYCEDREDGRVDPDGYECTGYHLRDIARTCFCEGSTRAEAVARAFVKVFKDA